MYQTWEELENSIKNCQKCKLCGTRQNIVFGVGNKNASIMFIGEGPGADEDRLGEPFVGRAGKLMNMAFKMVGIDRNDVYIANIVKCRPPQNRNPEDDEATACLDYLRNQVILVKPKIIVLLGSVALKNILGKEHGITAFSQEAGASVSMHGASGFGMYGMDVLVATDEVKRALQIIEAADDSQGSEKF